MAGGRTNGPSELLAEEGHVGVLGVGGGWRWGAWDGYKVVLGGVEGFGDEERKNPCGRFAKTEVGPGMCRSVNIEVLLSRY